MQLAQSPKIRRLIFICAYLIQWRRSDISGQKLSDDDDMMSGGGGGGGGGGSGGVRRSQSVKCNNQPQHKNQISVMSPNVDFLAELRNNKQFKRQEEKFQKWEDRKSVSLENLRTDRMVLVKEKLKKEKGGSEVALNETKTLLLAQIRNNVSNIFVLTMLEIRR